MGWVCIPCHPEEIPSCIEAVRGFQRNNLLWRWAGSVHEVYPEDFRDPSRDLLHLMVGLLPR